MKDKEKIEKADQPSSRHRVSHLISPLYFTK